MFVNEMAIQIRDRGHQDGAAARHVRRMNSCLAIEAPISAGKVQRSDGREWRQCRSQLSLCYRTVPAQQKRV
ncbi:MAG: hypothetical protein ABWY18_10635 [Tardiphaga sp.]